MEADEGWSVRFEMNWRVHTICGTDEQAQKQAVLLHIALILDFLS